MDEKERVSTGIAVAQSIVEQLRTAIVRADVEPDQLAEAGEVLRAIVRRLPDGKAESVAMPMIPLMDTTLLTNAPGEPRVGSQLLTEIESADRIDLVMAFIRYSGIRPLIEVLRRHCAGGKSLRVLTTIYTGSTEPRALDVLTAVGAQVRVSYDTSTTRLHAKGWLFQRDSGFSTAYIGSSNLTHSAQHDGLEWNVRISEARNPDVVEKLRAVFESYWNTADFEPYDRTEFEARLQRQPGDGDDLLLSALEPPTPSLSRKGF